MLNVYRNTDNGKREAAFELTLTGIGKHQSTLLAALKEGLNACSGVAQDEIDARGGTVRYQIVPLEVLSGAIFVTADDTTQNAVI
jgi:hypothetical protein